MSIMDDVFGPNGPLERVFGKGGVMERVFGPDGNVFQTVTIKTTATEERSTVVTPGQIVLWGGSNSTWKVSAVEGDTVVIHRSGDATDTRRLPLDAFRSRTIQVIDKDVQDIKR